MVTARPVLLMSCQTLLRRLLQSRAVVLPGVRWVSYVQGQSPGPRLREYFYFIDHQGQLFLDDTKVKNFITCFKDKQFLVFFFKQVQRNKSGRYEEDFPYISPCGREHNYIRCDDCPVVFTHLLQDERTGDQRLSYCGGGDKLVVRFEPEKLVMLPENGRVYHPSPEKCGSAGLVKSSLAFELSPCFEFTARSNSGIPTHFHWNGKRYTLTNELIPLISDDRRQEL